MVAGRGTSVAFSVVESLRADVVDSTQPVERMFEVKVTGERLLGGDAPPSGRDTDASMSYEYHRRPYRRLSTPR